MSIWKGLDSGGTEQLWSPDIIMDMLEVLRRHEPFSRNEPASPIFPDLEEIHPDITWRNYNADGSFRPIFRKTNPLTKLGLTTPEGQNAYLTDLGNELLDGHISIKQVFQIAARLHEEKDGTPSMAIMCHAGQIYSDKVFSVADIEYGVAETSDDYFDDLPDLINKAALNKSVKVDPTRARRIRGFMQTLISAGAFIGVDDGYKLHDKGAAIAISSTLETTEPEELTENSTLPFEGAISAKNLRQANFRKLGTEKKPAVKFKLREAHKSDPARKALLLERASNKHEETVILLSTYVTKLKLEPYEDPNSFDLAIFERSKSIFEVKTVNRANCISQLRKAFAQLVEYKWRCQHLFGSEEPQLFVVFDKNPLDYLPIEYFNFISETLGTEIIWPDGDQFVAREGYQLDKVLSL